MPKADRKKKDKLIKNFERYIRNIKMDELKIGENGADSGVRIDVSRTLAITATDSNYGEGKAVAAARIGSKS
jgi:hypothetical protein